MLRNYALSSMALLGLTRAQLWIRRSKTFTVHSVTPMDRLLTLVDDGDDNVAVELLCVDNPSGSDVGPYTTYYNYIQRPDIGLRMCPRSQPETANRRQADSQWPGYWKTNCVDDLADLDVYQESPFGFTEPPGGITCHPEHQLNIMIYNQHEPSISMTYNLDTWQYACIEDDYLSIYFGFGKRETFESKDACFANEAYIEKEDEPPFVVMNNCYGPRPIDPPDHAPWVHSHHNEAKPFEPAYVDDHDYWNCHNEGYRVDLHVLDNEYANNYFTKPPKIREPFMWVQVDFHRVKDYFQIFPEDKAKVSFWKGEDENPRSVVVSPFADVENVCDPERAADEIICENLSVFCTGPDDTVHLRIAAAGEILLTEAVCSDIVSGEFNYLDRESSLASDPEAYEAELGTTFLYPVPVLDHEEGASASAWFSFSYGTFERSNEKICFAGDFYPYMSPSCYLQNSGWPVSTQIHNPHEYAMDQFVMEIVLNSDYVPFQETEPAVFQMGGAVDLTNQLTQAIQGYVDLDRIDEAVPTSITITSLPACGSLWRQTQSEEEEDFAVFWTYDAAAGFVVQAAVGETIDFSVTQLYYEDDANCQSLAEQFSYTVMGAMEVDGPATNTDLVVVSTLWVSDYAPTAMINPENEEFEYAPINYSIDAPFGMRIGHCQSKPCAEDEEPVYAESGEEYNVFGGWWFMDTTGDAHNEDGSIKDEVYQWLYLTFCEYMDEIGQSYCPDTQVEGGFVAGIAKHADADFPITFEDLLPASYATLYYCPGECYTGTNENGNINNGQYDGVTENAPVERYVEYNIGQNGGQFMIYITYWKYAQMAMMSSEEMMAMQIAMAAWQEHYFSYFGAPQADTGVGGEWYPSGAEAVELFVPRAEAGSGQTVTFTDYASKGWLGYCSNENCEGEEPRSITLGFEYDATQTYFVYYATSDAILSYEEQTLIEEIVVMRDAYFSWVNWYPEPVPEAPSVDAAIQILEAIGASGKLMTVTLLWDAQVDLDLYFSCADGSQVNYQNTAGNPNSNCGGVLDVDMMASNYGNIRGDGVQGQIENISLDIGVDGHSYTGYVRYFGAQGAGNAPFELLFSGTDPATGGLTIFEHIAVETFDVYQAQYPYTFTYNEL